MLLPLIAVGREKGSIRRYGTSWVESPLAELLFKPLRLGLYELPQWSLSCVRADALEMQCRSKDPVNA